MFTMICMFFLPVGMFAPGLRAPQPGIDVSHMFDTPLRQELTREYSLRHYGKDTWQMEQPLMVVIHYTQNSSLRNMLKFFRPDRISRGNTYTRLFGDVNVSAHFLVDSDGSIYQILPETMIARHVIGFNHVAVGIENIARGPAYLTPEQLESNASLVAWLKMRHRSIRYLIGHHEYMRRDLPHFRHFLALDESYIAMSKADPGPEFMQQLRNMLAERYRFILEP